MTSVRVFYYNTQIQAQITPCTSSHQPIRDSKTRQEKTRKGKTRQEKEETETETKGKREATAESNKWADDLAHEAGQ